MITCFNINHYINNKHWTKIPFILTNIKKQTKKQKKGFPKGKNKSQVGSSEKFGVPEFTTEMD